MTRKRGHQRWDRATATWVQELISTITHSLSFNTTCCQATVGSCPWSNATQLKWLSDKLPTCLQQVRNPSLVSWLRRETKAKQPFLGILQSLDSSIRIWTLKCFHGLGLPAITTFCSKRTYRPRSMFDGIPFATGV